MASLCYFLLMLGFFSSIFFSLFLLFSLWTHREVEWIETIQKSIFVCVLICFLVLLYSFYKRDFSYVVVASYTDSYLPWYYALTAIWAGQEGSLLLWLFFISLLGVLFSRSKDYNRLTPRTKTLFWAMFFGLEGFFFSLLITVANPFLIYLSPPSEGMGLNPLLMHPGMVLHPPALFLGYAGFVVPALTVTAQRIWGDMEDTFSMVRNWTLWSWIFLSVGIILGMWWSYYELGWGGYWAWDPVENASLIPWLCATGFLHVYIVSKREKGLEKSSSFLIGLSLISCFIATFLTRSGIIDSLHAFGQSSLGTPIMWLILVSFVLVIYVSLFFPANYKDELSGLFSKNGMLVLTTWIFLSLGLIILIGTMYPVISEIFFKETKGLSESFYNRVFLPIGSFLIFLIVICPWIKWKSESIKKEGLFFIGLFIGLDIILWFLKIKNILILFSISAGICGILSVSYFIFKTKIYLNRKEIGKWGIHIGILMMAISIAISSGYKKTGDFIVAKGQKINFNGYKLHYKKFLKKEFKEKRIHRYVFDVYYKNKNIGELIPEKVVYFIQNNIFSKVDVIKRLFDEIYISVLQDTEDGVLKIEVQNNPMVHWIWFGSILITIMGIFATGIGRKGFKNK